MIDRVESKIADPGPYERHEEMDYLLNLGQ